MSHIKKHQILGVKVDPVTLSNTINIIKSWINDKAPNYICHTPAHAIMSCYDQPELKEIYNSSGLTVPDGMAIVWLLKLAGYKNVDRVYGPDLLMAVCRETQTAGYRHYFYGGREDVIHALVHNLQIMFPDILIAGYESPPFRDLSNDEKMEVNKRIKKSQADIVWVGLGSPKQELWMYENVYKLNGPVLIGIGAAFDFISGYKPQAPKWIQKIGMEWFFRWLSEPGRLFQRYIINYPRFIVLILLDFVKNRIRNNE